MRYAGQRASEGRGDGRTVGGSPGGGEGAWKAESALLFFPFMAYALRGRFKKHFPISGSCSFSNTFPSIRLVILPFTLKPLIPLESAFHVRCKVEESS